MKICSACKQNFPPECFSKTQWRLNAHQRKCKTCVANASSAAEDANNRRQTTSNDAKIKSSLPHCASCGKSDDGGLRRCSACKSVWYCDEVCQRNHRKVHRDECKRLVKEMQDRKTNNNDNDGGGATETIRDLRGRATPRNAKIGEQSAVRNRGNQTVVPDHAKIGEHRSLEDLFFLVYKEIGDKHLDYLAQKEAWSVTAQPCMSIALNRLHCRRDATPDILLNGSFECVKPSDVPPDFCYTMRDDNEDDLEVISFGDTSVRMEYSERHPGVFFSGTMVVPSYCNIQSYKPLRHAPITTSASKYLFSVAFVGGGRGRSGVDVVEMKAAYRLQFSLRIDEKSNCPSLNFDCFEHLPTCLDVTDTQSPDLPTYRELGKFDDTIEGSRSDDDSAWLDATAEHEGGNAFSSDSVIALNYQAFAGKFMNSRCFRLHIDLSNVCGIRLMSVCVDGRREIEGPNDIAAVLIIELKEFLGLDEKSFALRTVGSKSRNAFSTCKDWTPGGQASTAKRFFFYGNLEELRQTASIIAKLCPDIAKMLRSQNGNGNSLESGVAVDYDSTPDGFRQDGDADARKVPLDDIHPPPPSAWDGTLPNAREIFETMMAREENPVKQMMLRAMVDPESAIAINQDPNSSPEDVMLSSLAGQSIINNRGYGEFFDVSDQMRERGDQDCCVM